MGVVYKAHDTKLDRAVALKFLPGYLTSDAGEKERFYHEARAASALMHPNVAVIFEINEFEGKLYLAMEFVDGQTLKRLIGQDALTVKKVLDIAIQACEGLAAAHEKGIVHRDIKSDNMMMTTKGQLKIMDFGLAKIKGASKLTKAGSTVGTAAYMSPEQAQGEEVDHRSDIFSFGVVLYELLTTKLPFRGEHQAALMYSLINEDAQPIARFNEQVSPEIERIVLKALAKDREDRYQHVDDLLADLRRERKTMEYAKAGYVRTTTTAQAIPAALKPKKSAMKFIIPAAAVVLAVALLLLFRPFNLELGAKKSAAGGKKMLAVLPFENLGSADQDYFADGITEEITSRLSGLSGLSVIARSSAMQYKKTAKTIKQIGQELGVNYILEGTVRWQTSTDGTKRVRVNPQLIKVEDETQVWSQPSDAVLSDVFTLQSDISSQVAGALDVALLQAERKTLETIPTNNAEAYDAYLKGKEYVNRGFDENNFRIAEEMFQKAVALDPNFTLGYAKLSETHGDLYWGHYDHTEERVLKEKAAAEKALELGPDVADAHVAMGLYYYHGRLEYDNALREFDIAKKFEPNSSDIFYGIAAVQRRQGKMHDAIMNFSKAVDLDPRSADKLGNVGETYALVRDYDQAERYYDRAISIAPDEWISYDAKVFMYLLRDGNTTKARSVLDEAVQKVGATPRPLIRAWITVCMFDRQYEEAVKRLSGSSTGPFESQFEYLPRELFFAQLYGLMHQPRLEHAYYDSARIRMEELVKKQPEDSRFHSALGIAYAGLGRRQDAIREGKAAVEQLPISREAYRGAYRTLNLARIYAMVGDQDAAVQQLAVLLSVPSMTSKAFFRADPTWIPLRNNPKFQKLVE
jgi:TolB-like protein/Tfp pilus assembly protein PilF/predicted Ser/Thr protein kinase